MANTQNLKIIETEIKKKFLSLQNAQELKCKIPEIKPDIIAIRAKTLILGEITTSGYHGGRNHNKSFHTGAARKLTESYSKLDFLRREKYKLAKVIPAKFSSIEIHYVTIKDSKYQPKGWRKDLFKTCGLVHTEIKLNTKTLQIIKKSITKAKNEIKKK